MAKQLTLDEAVERFGPVVTSGLDIRDVIQEAVDRIYEMGRYKGTTREIQLDFDEFVWSEEERCFFVYFKDDCFDAAIGFRNPFRGWAIMDRSSLYRDGTNAGDLAFIDYGTEERDYVVYRKYRLPLHLKPEHGPFYVLIKLEAPRLQDNDKVPVHGVGALKCAIQAVCYEAVSDEARAAQKWQEFYQFIGMSERQAQGPKHFTINYSSDTSRRPRQFM
jgi:hypothetical protein